MIRGGGGGPLEKKGTLGPFMESPLPTPGGVVLPER